MLTIVESGGQCASRGARCVFRVLSTSTAVHRRRRTLHIQATPPAKNVATNFAAQCSRCRPRHP
eukprot:3701753-Prymnesium_polylepis.1